MVVFGDVGHLVAPEQIVEGRGFAMFYLITAGQVGSREDSGVSMRAMETQRRRDRMVGTPERSRPK
jgi:hypothetical protein